MSVENQRKILTAYAEENGITPYEFVADDGFSGSDWERPGLTGIIEEVEAGNVACLITKDA
jgi:DNA invertase Pin-like site-specific DNA recombinase